MISMALPAWGPSVDGHEIGTAFGARRQEIDVAIVVRHAGQDESLANLAGVTGRAVAV
jgi:hypothetical protein